MMRTSNRTTIRKERSSTSDFEPIPMKQRRLMKMAQQPRSVLRLLFGALAACFVMAPLAIPADVLRNVAQGEPLPSFELKTGSGELVSSKSFTGKVLVMVYLSAKQKNSEKAAIAATKVVKELGQPDVELLFVSADFEYKQSFTEQWERDKLSAPLAFDEDRALYGKLGLIVFPTTLVVDRKGQLAHVILTRRANYAHALDAYVRHALGQLDDEGLKRQLEAKSLDRASPQALGRGHRTAARLLREKGLLEGAEAELKTALELDSANIHIKLDLADLYVVSDRIEEGEALVRGVLQSYPKQRQAHLVLGIIHFKLNRLDESEAELLEALVHNPDPARTHYYLGQLYEAKGDTTKALEHYRRALERLLDE